MADDDMTEPVDPMTLLQAGAFQQHEMFAAWVTAGFTESQALELIKTVIHAMVMK